ncbi:MAG: FAD-dependent oxidoreductase, partial [Deltaproteobacteria bacterium]|nr:FAD-dependent oxidoreductase [Deltaproteobacteria bacterium]
PAPMPPAPPERLEKIAIIGSGPAGLAAAADLRRLGYQVVVFEKEAEAGGLLRYGIGPYRLPREILDHELDYIQKLGVRFHTSHPIDLQEDIPRLERDFDAVILTTGTWSDRMLGAPGEEWEGVEGCLSFLTSLYRGPIKKVKENIAVIGDGNSAFDLARALRRLGADVTIISWFPEDLIPADPEDIKGAREEGISLMDRTQVISFKGQKGRLTGLTCKPTEPGVPDAQGIPWPVIIDGSESFDHTFDRAIVAIGQQGPFSEQTAPPGLVVTAKGLVEVDESFKTSIPNLYAAGDAVTGPSSVVDAMSTGRAVAASVHTYLSVDEGPVQETWRPEDKDFAEIPADIPSLSRPTMPERQLTARCENFGEVALGLSQSQVLSEAERCLQCGLCSECLLCAEVCHLQAIHHGERPEEMTEHAGAVIIADPQAAPLVKGEDVIRAYGPKSAKPDVYAMITRGYAAAARAMVVLGGTTHRPKGQGLSFSPPGPELSPHIRVGVFVCRCNDSLGWHEEMDDYVARMAEQDDVVHTEVMSSACVPEGFGSMLKAIREKGITRVALASCVCCPLDFV